VLIVTDNQSPWTLGCYGNRDIETPNVDRLADEGLRFTESFCVNPVCSPNRATLLTGLIPSQHGVHNWLGTEQPDAQMGPDAYCTIGEFHTLPRILADAGYRCGMTGKWHLGDSLHPQLGFETWYAKPKGHTTSFYGDTALTDGQAVIEPGYYPEAITDQAVGFLERSGPDPFFLYVGYNGPYGLDQDLRTGHRNRHSVTYADKELRCFPREYPHSWLKQNRDCIGNLTAMRSYAAAVSGVDDGVGRVLEALDRLRLAEETIVIFTADHGLCAGHHGYWGMADHGRPLAMYEENLRVPLIWRHPGHIASAAASDAVTCNYDFLPSILEVLGRESALHHGLPLAGTSYADQLQHPSRPRPATTTYHEYENTRTIRAGQWKFTQRTPAGPDDLYDLEEDPQERRNLAGQPAHATIQADLERRLTAFFRQYADPEYDLWRGGRSKAGRAIADRAS
jgi:arylsulfatase A-like enzyme